MSNVTLDRATRERLRQLIDERTRRTVKLPVVDPTAEQREKWRGYQKAYRQRRREKLGLAAPPPTVNEKGEQVCRKGHPLTGENRKPNGPGKVRCGVCHLEYLRVYKRRQRARMSAEQLEAKRAAARAYNRVWRARQKAKQEEAA